MLFTPFRSRALPLILALLCIVSVARAQPTQLSDEAELRRAQTFYDTGKYAECVKEFDVLLGGQTAKLEDPTVLEKARAYYAACLIAVGKNDKAEEQFKSALRANPRMEPDPLVFPQVVLDMHNKVRDAMSEELRQLQAADLARKKAEAAKAAAREAAERRRVERLEELARREVIVSENDRWLAAIPLGVGQFQNREPALGWIFFGTELALAGTALGALIIESSLNAQADDNLGPTKTAELNTKVDTAHQVLVFSSWGFFGVAAVGILQAQIAYVPEFRRTRMRTLPPDLRRPTAPKTKAGIRPTALPTPSGLQLGVIGQF